MAWETAWEEVALARRFVQRLAELAPEAVHPAVPPALDRDPYLSAWTNVESALGAAPPADRERLERVLAELDGTLARLALPPMMAEAARRAVRGLLARRWLEVEESLRFVYEPFESLVPLSSLGT